ncbi:MAG: MMPL family transporter [Proteobacteria bacterium]|nr:MMPL family transporter [Pseudomonadota bacterium]
MPIKQDAPYKTPENRFFKAWAEIVLSYRWLFLLLTMAVTTFMGYQAMTRLKIDNSAEALLGSGADKLFDVDELTKLYNDFGFDNTYQILIEGDVFSLPYLNRLKALHQDLAVMDVDLNYLRDLERFSRYHKSRRGKPEQDDQSGVPRDKQANTDDEFDSFGERVPTLDDDLAEYQGEDGWGDEGGGTVVEQVVSLINIRQTSWQGGSLRITGLLDQWPTQKDLPGLKERVLSDRSLVGQIIGREGKHSVIIVKSTFFGRENIRKVYNEILNIIKKYEADGFHTSVAGFPALDASIDNIMLRDLRYLTLVSLIVSTIILTFIFRHPVGVIGPALVVVQSAVWTLGAMAMMHAPMTMITNILPAFLACVAIGDSIHIQSVYREALRRGTSGKNAIIHAVATTGTPIFYTTATTGVGLLSFQFATLGAIADMGLFGAIGIFTALILSLVFLPIVLTFNNKNLLGAKPEHKGHDRLDRFLGFCNNLSRARIVRGRVSLVRRHVTLLIAIAFTIVATLGALTLTVHHDALTWLPPESDVRKTIESVDENIGGTADVIILIKAEKGHNLKDRELLLGLQKLEEHIESYRDPNSGKAIVGAITSLLDVVRECWRAVNGSKEEFYKVPDTQRGVNDMIALFENSAPKQLRHLATIDMMNSVMTIRVKWMDAWSYKPLTEHIRRGVEEYVSDKASVKVTGTVLTMFTIVSAILTDLLKSFGLAFVVVTLMMILLLKNIKLGLISMVPNLLPVIAVMGIMGLASIPLDIANLVVASIIIGIAVDDTIHFLHQFKVHHQLHGNIDSAIDHSFTHSGRAMTITSIILVMGFCVFTISSMYPLQRFGLLTGMAVVFALLFDLIVGPVLLRMFFKQRLKKERA